MISVDSKQVEERVINLGKRSCNRFKKWKSKKKIRMI